MRIVSKVVLPLVLLALVVVGVVTFFFGGDHVKTLTAEFPRTVSIYQGSDVRVLGVPVGKIDSVTPSGTDVIVTMHYDADVQIPEDAKAVIVSPSIVGDRFVQLTPAYSGGPVLASGTTLTQDRTAVPLELDQIYSSLDDLSVALGPNGANKKGALTDLLDTAARNFGGQGSEVPPHDRGLQPPERDPGGQQGPAVRLGPRARGVRAHARAQRPHGAVLQRVAGPGLADAEGGARRPRGLPAQPRDRDAPGLRLRRGQPGDPRQEHHRARPDHPDPGQAAGRPRRDAARRAAGAQQPGPDLQPARPAPSTPAPTSASSDTRSSPTRRRSSAGSSTRRTRAVRRAAPSSGSSARAGRARSPAPRPPTSYDRMDPSLAGLVEAGR